MSTELIMVVWYGLTPIITGVIAYVTLKKEYNQEDQ